jgi:hypothetical protein
VGRERSSFAGVKTSRTSCFSVSWISQALRKVFFWVTILFTRFGESRGVRDVLLLGIQHWLWPSSRSSPVARVTSFTGFSCRSYAKVLRNVLSRGNFLPRCCKQGLALALLFPTNSRPSVKVDRFSKSGVKLSFQCLHLVPQLLHTPL